MHPPLTTHTPHAHRWMVWNIFYKRSMALKTNPRTMMGKGRGRRNRTVMRRRTLELNVSSVSQTHETPSSCRVGTSVSVAVAVCLLAWWWWSLTPPPLSLFVLPFSSLLLSSLPPPSSLLLSSSSSLSSPPFQIIFLCTFVSTVIFSVLSLQLVIWGFSPAIAPSAEPVSSLYGVASHCITV